MSTLREALAAKRVREAVYPIATADDSKAREKLNEAKSRRLLAGVGKKGDDEAKAAAEQAVADAQAEVDACYYPLRLRGIAADDLEALVSAHPPTPEQAEDGAAWNEKSLTPPLLAAVAVDSDLDEKEWAEELSSPRWTNGDRRALFRAAMGVCVHAINADLGKG